MSEREAYEARLRKVEERREHGEDAWKYRYDPTHSAAELHEKYASLADGESSGDVVRVAGRVASVREQGKAAFADLVDRTGRIQVFARGERVPALTALDVGDIAGVEGEVLRTRRGELSVVPGGIDLLAKALRPMPDKWHGLQNVETRFRRREVDLIANGRAVEVARTRVRAIAAFRRFLDERGFLEVETPTLHPIPGGGYARPFVTHYNALDADFYLRVATELYLKRLIVGGLERVYEIGRCYRNEGLSYKHVPEFTMLEAYQAYADYHDVMDLVEQMLGFVAEEAVGSVDLSWEERPVSLRRPWKRVSVLDAVSEAVGQRVDFTTPIDDLRALVAKAGVDVKPWWGHGWLIEQLRDELVEPSIWEPTILYDYPIEVSPLARTHREDPNLVERFEVICAGRELTNAFSELNDPIEQRRRFEARQRLREHGDEEANPIDEAFLEALEYGMPPTGGLGVGVDRFVMLLADVHHIREVILFPTLRPE